MKKPLRWKDVYGQSIARAGQFRQQYVIKPEGTGFTVQWQIPSGGVWHIEPLPPATTLAEAQATAQADYETR